MFLTFLWLDFHSSFSSRSHVINLLVTKFAQDDTERILGLCLFCWPSCAWSVLSRPWPDIFPVRPLRLVNKIYSILTGCLHCCRSLYDERSHTPRMPLKDAVASMGCLWTSHSKTSSNWSTKLIVYLVETKLIELNYSAGNSLSQPRGSGERDGLLVSGLWLHFHSMKQFGA